MYLLFLPEYVNQNGGTVNSDMVNPIYQNPEPIRGAFDETEEEYLNCFKHPDPIPAAKSPPEYLNTSQSQFLPSLLNGHGYSAQNSMDNPDYQQDFCPVRVKPNGHLPAAQNSEYLGIKVP